MTMFNYIRKYSEGTIAYYEDLDEIIVTVWNTNTDQYKILETFIYDSWKQGDKKDAITMAKGLIDSFCLSDSLCWSEKLNRFVTIPAD